MLPEDDELLLAEVVVEPDEDEDWVVVVDPDEDDDWVVVVDPDDDELLDELLLEEELLDEDELLDDELLEELLDVVPPSELLVVPHAAANAAEARINRYLRFMVSFPSP